jgi:hypothetical protein
MGRPSLQASQDFRATVMAAVKTATKAASLAAGLFFALAAPWACAQSVTDVPRDRFIDMTDPFNSRRVSHFFGPAALPSGEEITFSARGTVVLHVYRESPGIGQGATVAIVARDAAGRPVLSWKGEGMAQGTHMLKRVDVPPAAQSLSLKVFDKAEGGPTRSRPYTLIMEGWPLSESSVLEIASATSVAAGPPDGCRLVDRPHRRPDYLELSHRVRLGNLPAGVQVAKVLTAGGYLALSTSSPLPRGMSLRVQLFAKPSGDGPYRQVCDTTLSAASIPNTLEVTQGGVDQYAAWRVETTVNGRGSVPSGLELLVQRERLLASPDPFRAEPWNNARGLICFDRVPNQVAIASSTNRFAGRTRLNVRIGTQGDPLSVEQMSAVEDAVLKAAALWVHSCVFCKPENLSIISVNGKFYAHPGLFQIATSRGGWELANSLPPPEPRALDMGLASFMGTARVGIGAPFLPYKELPMPPPRYFQRICKSAATEAETPTLQHLQDAVCTEKPSAGTMANILIAFRRDARTACGAEADIIGCRADNELTEYNTRDYRFLSGGVSIGDGPVELDLLQAVLHEMGHWIGLEHIDGGDSIMSASLDKARCIDFETVKAVAEQIAVTEGRQRPASPSAFRLRGSAGR